MGLNQIKKLDLNITNRCNYRCVHCCFDSGERKMEELSFDEISRILSDARELGVERIDVTGGETLVRRDLEKILETGKSLGFRIELLTNGSLLSIKKLDRFKSIGLDAIGISLDGSTSEIYNGIRRQTEDTYRRIIDNIRLSKEFGFYTKVNTVVFRSNLEDIANITKLCIDLGIDEHGIYFFTPVGRGVGSKDLVVNPAKWLDAIKNNLMQYKKKMKLSIELVYAGETHCRTANTQCFIQSPHHLQILPDGNIYPCAIMAAYQRPLANLRNKSLKDVWQDIKTWKRYNKGIQALIKEHNGCVDYSGCFPDYRDYRFICPCRKFSIDEVLGDEGQVNSL